MLCFAMLCYVVVESPEMEEGGNSRKETPRSISRNDTFAATKVLKLLLDVEPKTF